MADINPFKVHIPQEELDLTIQKLKLARFPDELTLPASAKDGEYGADLAEVKSLVDYWQTKFDWRAAEAKMNEIPQFKTLVDTEDPRFGSLNIHFVWKKSGRPGAIPLLFVHGWPGNFLEVSKLLEPLTNPADPAHPHFDVVAPSLPGYCFSDTPTKPGFGPRTSALIFDKLMTKLGYSHYAAQGGDWGSIVCRFSAIDHWPRCRGIHINMLPMAPPTIFSHPLKFIKMVASIIGGGSLPGGYSKAEITSLMNSKDYFDNQSGYLEIQSTKPQTLGFGLNDSPVATLAWILEKLHAWTDEYPWTPDEILTWIGLYWYCNPTSTVRFYKEFRQNDQMVMSKYTNVPLGVSVFPKEIIMFPDDFGHMIQPLKFVRRHARGGHFAAWEKPEELTGDIREYFGKLQKVDASLRQN